MKPINLSIKLELRIKDLPIEERPDGSPELVLVEATAHNDSIEFDGPSHYAKAAFVHGMDYRISAEMLIDQVLRDYFDNAQVDWMPHKKSDEICG